MRHVINSRADLENLRGTADFEATLRGLHGAFTTWNLVDDEWVAQENLSAIERFDYDKAGFLAEIAPFDFPPPVKPSLPVVTIVTHQHLSARQLRLGLVAAGILPSQVDAAISAIPDATARAIAEIEWEYASQFERNHPLIEQVGGALGLTPEQVDTMWEQALVK